MSNRRIVPAVLACFAAAGLVGAHVLAYVIALPDPAVRATFLRVSGHSYFSAAAVVAVVAAIFGSFAAAALGVRTRATGRTVRWREVAVRIALVQTAAFAVLEIAERVAAGVSPAVISPRLALIGVAVQVIVACIAAFVLLLICRAAVAVWRALSGTPERTRRAIARRPSPFVASPPQLAFTGSFDSRAPPAASR